MVREMGIISDSDDNDDEDLQLMIVLLENSWYLV